MNEPIPAKDKGGLAQLHDKNKNKLALRSSDADGVPGDAYIHRMHVGRPGTDSSESSQNDTRAAEGNSTTIAEEGAKSPFMQSSGNKDSFEQGSPTGPVANMTSHILQAIPVDTTPNPAHEMVEGLGGRAPGFDTDLRGMPSQQALQCTNKLNEVLTTDLQIYQVDAHHSDSAESSSLLLYDESSPGTQRESLRSSSPMPVPSSPLTSNPTPPSSVPSSPLVLGIADVPAPVVALDKLQNLSDLELSRGSPSSVQQPQTRDVPAIAASGTILEQEQKVQICRSVLPTPRHPTAIAQRKQHEKLSRPFRPPTLVAPERGPTDNTNKGAGQVMQYTTPPRRVLKSPPAAETENRSKNKMPGAAIQFKSPLISRNALEDSSVRLTPTIQMLERKLQILKRAIKVKEDNQEDQLRGLITKWTEAGREVAWDLWEIVGNNTNGAHRDFTSGKRMYEDSWGWEMGSDKRFKEGEDRGPHSKDANNGIGESDTMERVDLMKGSDEDEDFDRSHDTLGTMLRQLGIDPQTLNWDEEEGAFKEVTNETR